MHEDAPDDKNEMGGRHAMMQSLLDDPVQPGQDNATSAAGTAGSDGSGGAGSGLPQVV